MREKDEEGKSVKKGNSKEVKSAPKAKSNGARHRPCHNSFTRKCLSKASKVMFKGCPREFLRELVGFERKRGLA